jgi:ribosomal protein S18 acetylase RimI-like enzyme
VNRFTIRRAGSADAAAIAQLHIASWQVAYRGMISDAFLDSQNLPARILQWRNAVDDKNTMVLVAESAGALLGFCACGVSRDSDARLNVWEIYNLHAAPERRGEGVGTRLFDAAVALGAANGASELTLWVALGNEPARKFYEHKGMAPDGGQQAHTVGPKATLREMRYRAPFDRLVKSHNEPGQHP